VTDITVEFLSAGRKAQVAPNPEFPGGIDIDSGFREMCSADLPYPAECCGSFLVACKKCGMRMAFTAAGRVDDPRRVQIPCQKAGNRQIYPVKRYPHEI
jgi:hypothetical protein